MSGKRTITVDVAANKSGRAEKSLMNKLEQLDNHLLIKVDIFTYIFFKTNEQKEKKQEYCKKTKNAWQWIFVFWQSKFPM